MTHLSWKCLCRLRSCPGKRRFHSTDVDADSDSRGQHNRNGVLATWSAACWTVQVGGSCDKIPDGSGNQNSSSRRVRALKMSKRLVASSKLARKCVSIRRVVVRMRCAAKACPGRGAFGCRCRQRGTWAVVAGPVPTCVCGFSGRLPLPRMFGPALG